MGYRLNRLDEPVFMAVPKPILTEFGIHYRLESCENNLRYYQNYYVYLKLFTLSFYQLIIGLSTHRGKLNFYDCSLTMHKDVSNIIKYKQISLIFKNLVGQQ